MNSLESLIFIRYYDRKHREMILSTVSSIMTFYIFKCILNFTVKTIYRMHCDFLMQFEVYNRYQ